MNVWKLTEARMLHNEFKTKVMQLWAKEPEGDVTFWQEFFDLPGNRELPTVWEIAKFLDSGMASDDERRKEIEMITQVVPAGLWKTDMPHVSRKTIPTKLMAYDLKIRV